MTAIDLKNPSVEYRPIPFWSWNDKLEIPELCRQIREMKKAGIGGFFMHARGGLQTRYLSREWMNCVSACLAEAHKLNMHAWLYDENGWPSGFGGGVVNGMGETYQLKYLRYEFVDAGISKEEHTIGYYTQDGSKLLGRHIPSGYSEKLLRCYYEVNPYYVDNLDAEVVRQFIASTHERYYAELPKELLPYLKGIFTDEPQLSRNGLLWSFVLEEEYRSAYGRDLLEELPALFLPLKGCEAMRIRFWKLVGKLFRNHFIRQIREWCNDHGWSLTGHHVLEETLQWQVISSGSLMAQYPYYSIPGVDHLCRELPSVIMMTQIASAAAQTGQKQILSESFGCTGWNCNFIGQRWLYQPQLAHGINLLCQHLSGYTLRGARKRDYPCGFFYHQPWWKDYSRNNDFFARIGEGLANGTQNVRVLVLHPLSSAWCLYRGPESIGDIDYYTLSLKKLSETLDAYMINHQSSEIYDKIERAKKFETEFNTLAFDTEIESIYLVGQFGVFHCGDAETLSGGAKRLNGEFQIGALQQKAIDVSSLLNAGLPFFAGNASFRCFVELTEDDVKEIDVLQFIPYGANSWKVQINGIAAGEFFQGPYAINVSGMLQPGKNNLVFEMTTSLRNMLGPHHLANGEDLCISPMAFLREKDCVGHNPPETVDGFCLIEHGIGEIHLKSGQIP